MEVYSPIGSGSPAKLFQANPKFSQAGPNPAKADQRESKENPGINFDFLVRIEPFQWVTPTPRPFFLFSRPADKMSFTEWDIRGAPA
jgi:hypothetical protein